MSQWKFSGIKSGIWHLSQQCRGACHPRLLARSGSFDGQRAKIPVPFFIDIFIDEPLFYDADKVTFKQSLLTRFVTLQQQATRRIT